MKLFASILLAVAMAACGGKSSTDTTPAAGHEGHDGHEMHAMHEGHDGHHGQHDMSEHPPLTAEMTAFHDLLSPLWHAEPGEERTTNTCDATTRMREVAEQIFAAPPAGADVTIWSQAASALDGALNDLEGPCTGGTAEQGAMSFDDAFKLVHDRFHELMALLPEA